MPVYGQVYQPHPSTQSQRNPATGYNWDQLQSDYIKQFPDALNSWMLNQWSQANVGQAFHDFANVWLPNQLKSWEGNQLVNPEQSYQSFLGGQNPWNDFEQQELGPRYNRAMRNAFPTPIMRR
jgi:hypothetical protein